jgi:hypothetical protein
MGCRSGGLEERSKVAGEHDRVHVAFIAGAGLSGSTLLEQSLSQVEGCFTLGELYWMWKPYWPLMVCECGEQFKTCPFWQAVLDDTFGVEQELMRARIESLGEGFIRHSIAPTARNWRPRYKVVDAFHELGSLLAPVYKSVAKHAGASVVVDATKAALWGMCGVTSDEIEMSVVRLVRDPRGFAFSNARARDFHYPPGSKTTPHGATRSYINWLLANLEGDWLARQVPNETFVFYDQFANDPIEAVRPIVKLLGLDPDAHTAITHDGLDISRVGHAIGGNPRRPKQGKTVIKADDEWMTAAKPSVRALAPFVLPLWRHYRRKAGLPQVA